MERFISKHENNHKTSPDNSSIYIVYFPKLCKKNKLKGVHHRGQGDESCLPLNCRLSKGKKCSLK